jgi:hypothetical protein
LSRPLLAWSSLSHLVEQRFGDVSVCLRVESLEPQGFGHNPPAITPFKVNHKVNGIADIGADRLVWQVNSGL